MAYFLAPRPVRRAHPTTSVRRKEYFSFFTKSLALLALVVSSVTCPAAVVQDEIFGDGVDGFDSTPCDNGLPSSSTDAVQYAAALDLCQATTEISHQWGLISASLTLASSTGTPAAASHSIRTEFGANNTPRAGSSMIVLSTGAAAALGQTNPAFVAPQLGLANGTSSAAPSDWVAAHGGTIPAAPGCPAPTSTNTVDPVMLTLRIRVPSNARSLSLAANYLAADFPENVCGTFNDVFVALLDSSYAGAPANPADKNLATFTASNQSNYPLGVNLARDNTGLFTQCVNGNTGCEFGAVAGAISTCTGTAGLVGTGMDVSDPNQCGTPTSLVGGGTGWLTLRGNVVPGEIIQLRLAIWDTGDGLYDSSVLLDKLRWSYTPVAAGTFAN